MDNQAPPTQSNQHEYGKNDSISFWLNKHFTIAKNQDNNAYSLNYFLALFIISCIPIYGFIMLIRWANDNGDNIRKNLSKASLILIAVSILLGIILNFIVFSLILGSKATPAGANMLDAFGSM